MSRTLTAISVFLLGTVYICATAVAFEDAQPTPLPQNSSEKNAEATPEASKTEGSNSEQKSASNPFVVVDGGKTPPEKTQSKQKPAPSPFDGCWRAESFSVLSASGGKFSLSKSKNAPPLCAIIADGKISLCLGKRQFAEIAFEAKLDDNLWIIDSQYAGQAMHGLGSLSDDQLKFCLNDAAKPRAAKLAANSCDLYLELRRFRDQPLRAIDADGGNLRILVERPGYAFGSSSWSPDGKRIVVDSWNALAGDGWRQSEVAVYEVQAKNEPAKLLKVLCAGAAANWSPDGKRIAFSKYGNAGVWTIKADGTSEQRIDTKGWGASWSPVNEEIVFSKRRNNSENLSVFDCKTKQTRFLLDDRYRAIGAIIAWSPDGKHIAFRGTKPNGENELAVVNAKGYERGMMILFPRSGLPKTAALDEYFSWNGDGKKIAAVMTSKEDANRQIYLFDVEGETPAVRLVGQHPSNGNYAPAFSRDGKTLAFASHPGSPASPSAIEEMNQAVSSKTVSEDKRSKDADEKTASSTSQQPDATPSVSENTNENPQAKTEPAPPETAKPKQKNEPEEKNEAKEAPQESEQDFSSQPDQSTPDAGESDPKAMQEQALRMLEQSRKIIERDFGIGANNGEEDEGDAAETADDPQPAGKTFSPHWNSCRLLLLNPEDEWQIDVPAQAIPKPNASSVPFLLPKKRNFFDGLQKFVVNQETGKAALSYQWDFNNPKGISSRFVICDLKKGSS